MGTTESIPGSVVSTTESAVCERERANASVRVSARQEMQHGTAARAVLRCLAAIGTARAVMAAPRCMGVYACVRVLDSYDYGDGLQCENYGGNELVLATSRL